MSEILFSVLQPLVFNGESGVMAVVNNNTGDQANIYLKEGMVEGITVGTQGGLRAARECAGWVNTTIDFAKGEKSPPSGSAGADTNQFLGLLEKVGKNLVLIRNEVPNDSAILKIDLDRLNSQDNLSAQDLKVALLFDGKRPLSEVLGKSGVPEVQALAGVFRLKNAGVAIILTSHTPMDASEREAFLKDLGEMLVELVGPAAEMLIEDAFDTMGSAPDVLAKQDIPKLMAHLAENMEEEEKQGLEKWSAQNVPS